MWLEVIIREWVRMLKKREVFEGDSAITLSSAVMLPALQTLKYYLFSTSINSFAKDLNNNYCMCIWGDSGISRILGAGARSVNIFNRHSSCELIIVVVWNINLLEF